MTNPLAEWMRRLRQLQHSLKLSPCLSRSGKVSAASSDHADVEANTVTARISAAEEGTAAVRAGDVDGLYAGGCGGRWLHVGRGIAR